MTGEKYIDVDGIKTRYFEKGSGPLVVLFYRGHFGSHDAADCAEDWSLNFDGLADRFHVFAVDKIGQGFTDNPKRDEDYTIAAVVQHAYGFLRTLGLSRGAFARRLLGGSPDTGTSGAIRKLHSCGHQYAGARHQQERDGYDQSTAA
jgi:pimeloyl-ACP methyl ester carboxylesterase